MKLTGGQMVCESLLREGADVVFGVPGGAILPFYDYLTQYPKIHHVLVRHEQGGAHAADGYARVTGKVGVCLATSGPGALNLTTGLANAFMDSCPIVAITGQVSRFAIGKVAFQETDVTGATLPVTKHNYLVMRAADIPRVLKEAFYIARTGRPGPVLVDIPKDVFTETADYEYPETVNLPGYHPQTVGDPAQIQKAAKLINGAKRPVILAGRGVLIAGAMEELRLLAEKAQVPVVPTLLGLSCFPGSHYLNVGMMGMHGSAYANIAVDECDVLIGVGCRFDDRITGRVSDFARHAQIIHVDIEPANIRQNIRTEVPIVGDAKSVLRSLIPLVEPAKRSEWLQHIDDLRRAHPLVVRDFGEAPSTQHVIQQLFQETHGNAIVVTGVGQHQMRAGQHYIFDRPMTMVTSGGLGTMGYEIPAAMGAQLGRPDALVWSVAGDGGFQMTVQELATIRDEKLPVKFAIMNNGFLGMVRQWQELFYEKRYSQVKVTGPDFVKLAEAYGMLGLRATRKEEVAKVIRQANAHRGPVLVDFQVAAEENVYPMIPSGQSVKELMEDTLPGLEPTRR
ncbi:MAG: biosynthetic-type acetolactate synthase large subunit [Chloroflexi bacterium]|nr:biosynthetic-type acetolactate synthase large subunit [Chloroflexota bacterium]